MSKILNNEEYYIRMNDASGNAINSTSNALDINIASGSITIPSGAATEAKQDTMETSLNAIQTAVEGTVAVSGTFWQATQPVSGTVTANLGATDNGVLDNIDTNTSNLDTKLDHLSDNLDTLETSADAIQAAVEGTLTVASHHVTNAGTFAVQAAQATHNNFNCNANMQIADTDLAFGSANSAASLPVVLASDQAYAELQSVNNCPPPATLTGSGSWDNSTSADCRYMSKVVAFGLVDPDTDVEVRITQSNDNVTFYETGTSWLSSGTNAQDFFMSLSDAAARYYRLEYKESNATPTTTNGVGNIAAKQ